MIEKCRDDHESACDGGFCRRRDFSNWRITSSGNGIFRCYSIFIDGEKNGLKSIDM
jgi:hypothetical protein